MRVQHNRKVFSVTGFNLYSQIKAQQFASTSLGSLNLKINTKYVTGEKIKSPRREDGQFKPLGDLLANEY